MGGGRSCAFVGPPKLEECIAVLDVVLSSLLSERGSPYLIPPLSGRASKFSKMGKIRGASRRSSKKSQRVWFRAKKPLRKLLLSILEAVRALASFVILPINTRKLTKCRKNDSNR